MDRFESIRTLIAAIEGGSLSAAGHTLNMPLPTVSRKVSELEAHLGAKLVIRSTRGLKLTEAGENFAAAAKRVLEQLAEAERAAAGEYAAPKGDLVIAAPAMFGRLHVLPVIGEFLALYPDVNVRVVLADRNAHLIEDHVDIAIRVGTLPDSALIARRVGEARRVVCGSPALFREHGVPKTPQDLGRYPCIAYEGPGSSLFWSFRGPNGRVQPFLPDRQRLTVNTTDAAITAAVAGIGVTCLLSYQVAPQVRGGELQVVLADFESEPVPIHLLHPAQGLMPAKTRTFLDFAATRLREALAAR